MPLCGGRAVSEATTMAVHPLAGQTVPADQVIDPARLEQEYYSRGPDVAAASQLVSFGTSGHRGSPLDATFTEAHVLAMSQAICDYRARKAAGPRFVGKDTHRVSGPAQRTALEVLAANGVEVFIQRDDGATPTPVISHAILAHNRARRGPEADGIVITPSHNPPSDGGFKYNPPHGGPAATDVTRWIQDRANALLREGNRKVRRMSYEAALRAATTHLHDFVAPYTNDLAAVVDLEAVRGAGLTLGVDALGGASVDYWERIRDKLGVNLKVFHAVRDPTFGFMTLDHDGKVRMDCSSPYAMAALVRLKDHFDLASGNDPDADRHGIVTRSGGLMNPNHYLAVAIDYLLSHRPGWPQTAAVGKTVVSSSMIDRVVHALGRRLVEVPVGFKWFASGLLSGTLCFGGEESAGASFLREDGTVWTTDKDGIILSLLAAEIQATTGEAPDEHYRKLEARFGRAHYVRIDTPVLLESKARLARLSAQSITARRLAGDPIDVIFTEAPGNGAAIGGVKVTTPQGWFAARPSGTEPIYKLYAESWKSESHLDAIVEEAQQLIAKALEG